jgi:thioredoxin reductase (NADPH)
MVHRKDKFRAQKAIAEQTIKNPAHTDALLLTVVSEIKGNGTKVSWLCLRTWTRRTREMACDAVFIFIGMDPAHRARFPRKKKKTRGGYLVTDENMQTSIRGLFAAGDIRSKPFRQIITAAADGAVAAHAAASCIDEQMCGSGL